MAGVTSDEGWLLAMGLIPEMRTQLSVELFLRAVSAMRTQFHNIDPNEVSDHYIKNMNKCVSTEGCVEPTLRGFIGYMSDLSLRQTICQKWTKCLLL